MLNQYLHWSFIFSALCLLIIPSSSTAQQRLDLGVMVGPEVNWITSEPWESELPGLQTTGGTGVSLGYTAGAYLEYEIFSGLFLRGGLNYTRKRYNYDVSQRQPENGDEIANSSNRIVYTAIEIPVAILYRFLYLRNNDRFAVGVGGVVDRWLGDPQVETDFVAGSADRSYIDEAYRGVNFFVGYDHYISDRFVLGIEPYIAYSPTRFRFETASISKNDIQAGIAARLRFDN
ncbi:outer membrane beta-barrel protein [Lewinella sp. IMCC34191]|uniref:outer membrane beta-barrel protein n=1 Tax=Lewinella sp. IMCC34191 TaxID=2259172 RepID=UPI000E24ACB8|nr:outer membrane beta-barrel protein [Lewinella sp. IMCC34191]